MRRVFCVFLASGILATNALADLKPQSLFGLVASQLQNLSIGRGLHGCLAMTCPLQVTLVQITNSAPLATCFPPSSVFICLQTYQALLQSVPRRLTFI